MMVTAFKLLLGGNKRQVASLWQAAILELKDRSSGKVSQFTLKDIERNIKDDPNTGVSYFEVPDVPEGRYDVIIRDIHMGHPIFHGEDIAVRGKEFMFEGLVEEFLRTRQANTYAMDFVVDAPYRLQKSCPYLPVLVFVKDVKSGEIKVKSVDFYAYNPSAVGDYEKLPPSCIFRVFDVDGMEVKDNGNPSILRFDEGSDHETVMTDPWYRIILLHRDQLPILQGNHLGQQDTRYLQYQVKVRYERNELESKRFVFRTLVPEGDLPEVENWYYGDTHYHSEFTDNPYEFGGPLSMTAEVARAVGLSWVTVTDHSYCLNHPKTPAEKREGNRWKSYKEAIKRTNERYRDILCVGAEEITVRQYLSGLHLLSFGNPFIEDEHPAGFGSVTMEEVFERIRSSGGKGGFIYAAHPSSEGYIWHEEDYEVATDPKNRDLFAGLQIFNEKILYKCITKSMDRDVLDPFDILDEDDRQHPWSKELQEGITDHWVERFLLPPLRDLDEDRLLRKYFILAGSDAHMDFNCSFRPHPAFLIHYLNDNALGKVRTLAYLPRQNGEALTERRLYEALRNGRTLLTDGPLVLFSLRVEGDERIYRLGDTLSMPQAKQITLSIEWHSTPEFGPVGQIKLCQGTRNGEQDIAGQIDFSTLRGNGYQGQVEHLLPEPVECPCYLRLEANSGVDPDTGEGLFRCITNPIWILKE